MPRIATGSLLAILLVACSKREIGTDAASLKPGGAALTAAARSGSDSVLARVDAGRIIGNGKATVWMIVISDFQCPYCKAWHDESWAAIRKDYVDTGKIRVAYVNLPLEMHRNAWPAAEAAMCAAEQGKFWAMQDALFRAQDEWKALGDPAAAFESMAAGVGADVAALRSCVKAGVTRPLILADADRAAKAGVSSTPTFFVGARAVVGAQPLAAFREALDAALATAAASPAPAPTPPHSARPAATPAGKPAGS